MVKNLKGTDTRSTLVHHGANSQTFYSYLNTSAKESSEEFMQNLPPGPIKDYMNRHSKLADYNSQKDLQTTKLEKSRNFTSIPVSQTGFRTKPVVSAFDRKHISNKFHYKELS